MFSLKSVIWTSLLLFSTQSMAYYTFQDTGELLRPGQSSVGGELQFVTSEPSGINVIGRFDGGWKDDLNYRVLAGVGVVDFEAGGYVKWVPIPDHLNQPAFGLNVGGLIASYSSNTELALRVSPFISKAYNIEFGKIIPYAALPLGLTTYDNKSGSSAQFIIGSQFVHPEMAGAQYYAELGMDIDDSPSYFGIGAMFPLNDNNLIDLWPGDEQ